MKQQHRENTHDPHGESAASAADLTGEGGIVFLSQGRTYKFATRVFSRHS